MMLPVESSVDRNREPAGDPKRPARDSAPHIVEGLRMGDHDCYRTVFYQYHKSINDFLRVLVKSDDAANDITQEVFLTLWENRESLDPEKGIVRFLFRLAKQAVIHHYRRSEVRNSYARSVSDLWDDTGGMQGDELLEAKEAQLLIDIVVGQMPKTRRNVFEMSRYEGLSIDEIASRLDISKDSVSSHIYNALRDIREAMALLIAIAML